MPKDEFNLSPKERRFADEWIKDPNGTKAVIIAGYAEKSARITASKLLTKPNIKAYIANITAKLQKKVGIDQEWVLRNWQHLAEYNAQKIQVPHGSGDSAIIHDIMRDASVVQRATDSAAKHLGMFTEKLELAGKDGKDLFERTPEQELELARSLAALLSNPKLLKK